MKLQSCDLAFETELTMTCALLQPTQCKPDFEDGSETSAGAPQLPTGQRKHTHRTTCFEVHGLLLSFQTIFVLHTVTCTPPPVFSF